MGVNVSEKMRFNTKRRSIIKAGAATLLAGTSGLIFWGREKNEELISTKIEISPVAKKIALSSHSEHEHAVRDSLNKIKNFNQTFTEDIFLNARKRIISKNILDKILKIQNVIGYANFNLISFDDMLIYSGRFPQIGRLTKTELALIDEIFFYDAHKYGFHGNKVITDLSSKINKKETIKIAGSGHYLFQGEAHNKFKKLKNDIGPDLILTSGVRSVVKQLQLFLAKLNASDGNLSLASRSLAPPGHSYHGIGDFDVGKKGFGKLNFTSQFSTTEEYKKLIELQYIDIRYTQNNNIGVRYEPWHIKVV